MEPERQMFLSKFFFSLFNRHCRLNFVLIDNLDLITFKKTTLLVAELRILHQFLYFIKSYSRTTKISIQRTYIFLLFKLQKNLFILKHRFGNTIYRRRPIEPRKNHLVKGIHSNVISDKIQILCKITVSRTRESRICQITKKIMTRLE